MRTYKEIRDEARGLFKSLADATALRDMDGFAQELEALAQEADAAFVNDPDSDDRLESLGDALSEAAGAVMDMLDNFSEAYTALDGVVR